MDTSHGSLNTASSPCTARDGASSLGHACFHPWASRQEGMAFPKRLKKTPSSVGTDGTDRRLAFSHPARHKVLLRATTVHPNEPSNLDLSYLTASVKPQANHLMIHVNMRAKTKKQCPDGCEHGQGRVAHSSSANPIPNTHLHPSRLPPACWALCFCCIEGKERWRVEVSHAHAHTDLRWHVWHTHHTCSPPQKGRPHPPRPR